MKKNGFVTSAFLYGMLALFIVLMLSTLAILANRKISMDHLKEDAIENATKDLGGGNTVAKEDIINKIENPDEGLEEDSTVPDDNEEELLPVEEGKRYIYTGLNPKNYIMFNEELWRIMAIEPNGKLKIVKDDLIAAGIAYDAQKNRSSGYCYSGAGCSIWGNSSNTYDKDGNFITTLPLKVGGKEYVLPNKDSTLNVYLNNDYYNDLRESAKTLMTEGEFNVGAVALDGTKTQTLKDDVEQASSARWKGKVGLIDVTEYVKGSTYDGCESFNNGSLWVGTGTPCKQENYLYVPADSSGITRTWQTLTPAIKKNNVSNGWSCAYLDNCVYTIRPGENGNDGYFAGTDVWYSTSLKPVVYLRNDIIIADGDGTKEKPYIVEVPS